MSAVYPAMIGELDHTLLFYGFHCIVNKVLKHFLQMDRVTV